MFLCYPKTDLNLRWNGTFNKDMVTNAIFFSNSLKLSCPSSDVIIECPSTNDSPDRLYIGQ